MKHLTWHTLSGVVEATFNMLSWIFVLVLFVNEFTDGLVAIEYINLDYLLLVVIVFGAILISSQLQNASISDSIDE